MELSDFWDVLYIWKSLQPRYNVQSEKCHLKWRDKRDDFFGTSVFRDTDNKLFTFSYDLNTRRYLLGQNRSSLTKISSNGVWGKMDTLVFLKKVNDSETS